MRALVPLLVAVLNLASPVLAQVRGDPDVVAGLMTGAGMKVTHTTSAEGAPMLESSVDGVDFVVFQSWVATLGRHGALIAVKAFDGVLVEGVLALGDARAPVGLVTKLGCASHAGLVAHGAGLLEKGFALASVGSYRSHRGGCGFRGRCGGSSGSRSRGCSGRFGLWRF